MLYIPALWTFDISVISSTDFVGSNLLCYPHVLYNGNICETFIALQPSGSQESGVFYLQQQKTSHQTMTEIQQLKRQLSDIIMR